MNFHIFAVGWAAHDDLLFVQLAANIGRVIGWVITVTLLMPKGLDILFFF